jgi:hypothetical protein
MRWSIRTRGRPFHAGKSVRTWGFCCNDLREIDMCSVSRITVSSCQTDSPHTRTATPSPPGLCRASPCRENASTQHKGVYWLLLRLRRPSSRSTRVPRHNVGCSSVLNKQTSDKSLQRSVSDVEFAQREPSAECDTGTEVKFLEASPHIPTQRRR